MGSSSVEMASAEGAQLADIVSNYSQLEFSPSHQVVMNYR